MKKVFGVLAAILLSACSLSSSDSSLPDGKVKAWYDDNPGARVWVQSMPDVLADLQATINGLRTRAECDVWVENLNFAISQNWSQPGTAPSEWISLLITVRNEFMLCEGSRGDGPMVRVVWLNFLDRNCRLIDDQWCRVTLSEWT